MTSVDVATDQHSDLWGICAYFNPLGYDRRLANYRAFRKHLTIPLLTVEFGYRGSFELTDQDADIVIRCAGDDVLWQRERLLNVAIAALPAACRFVVRLDGDVVFADPDWHFRVREQLSRFPMIQPFSEAHDLPADALHAPRDYFSETPAWEAFAVAWDRQPDRGLLDRRVQPRGKRSTCAMGLAWAIRRELHDQLPIYDACVLGGAEHALLCAACGVSEIVVDYQRMGSMWTEHYQRWADQFQRRLAGKLGFIEGRIGHLWHGHVANRGYATRYRDFVNFDFDPNTDIKLQGDGSWQWASDKPAMHDYVRNYFVARKEDG